MVKTYHQIFFGGLIMISMCAHSAIYHCTIKNAQSVSDDGVFTEKKYFASSYVDSKFSIDTRDGRILSNRINLKNIIDQQIIEKGGDFNDFKMYTSYADEYKKIFILEISDNKFYKDKGQIFPFSIYMDKYHMSGICKY